MDGIVRAARLQIAVVMAFGIVAASRAATPSPPPEAIAAGFTQNTFSAFKPGSIDIKDAGKTRFSWYLFHFFGSRPHARNIILNADGSVTFNGDTTGPNGELATAAPAKSRAKFVGVAFGGGAYIEATIKFDPNAARSRSSNGWPSFWAMALEHVATGTDQWPGEPEGYKHFVEADFSNTTSTSRISD